MKFSTWHKFFPFDMFRTAVLLADGVVMTLALWVAYWLVFDGMIPQNFLQQWPYFWALSLGCTYSLFAGLGVYSRRLPHLGEREIRMLVWGAFVSELCCFVFETIVHPSYWVYGIVFWFLFFIIRSLMGIYASYRNRLLAEWSLWGLPAMGAVAGGVLLKLQELSLPFPPSDLPVSRTIHALYFLISVSGFVLLRWFFHWVYLWYQKPLSHAPRAILLGDGLELSLFARLNELSRSYQVVAILDNNPLQWGVRVRNVRVLGGLSQLQSVAQQLGVDTVLLLRDSLNVKETQDTEELCRAVGLKMVRLGSVHESLLRSDSLSTADLLERQEYRFLPSPQENYLAGKCVLVTGAGGSIGSELVRQVLRCEPRLVILLGRGENSLFELEQELVTQGLGAKIVAHVVNICNIHGLEQCFAQYRPEVVFHAAAHKHVPLMENNVSEAVLNNVWGTWHVMQVAGRFQAERVVMISTDKAVAPRSVMGATKRKAEQLVAQCAQQFESTAFCVVRFGNVLGSRGSVVRIFQEQIRRGGPVTVTDPRMTRYFMTIPEAVSLVLASGGLGRSFAIYVLEMGQPYRIVELAEKMIRLCGLEPGRDIAIQFTGVRPGEKLEEVLVTASESLVETSNHQIKQLVTSDSWPLERWSLDSLPANEGELRQWLLGAP